MCRPSLQMAVSLLHSPDSSGAEMVKAGFNFGADPVQWRACFRRMARARLLRVLPSDTGTQRLASGAFAVAKDHRRFIGDRRRQNEKERLIHRVCSPHAPRPKRIQLKNSYSLRLDLRDVRDCFCLFQVDDEPLKGRSSGLACRKICPTILRASPRISCRSMPSRVGSAVTSLIRPTRPVVHLDASKWPSQEIMVGDTNAVAALQNAQRWQLLACEGLLLPGTPSPREQVFRDVYVGDFAVLPPTVPSPNVNCAWIGLMPCTQLSEYRSRNLSEMVILDGQRGKLGFPMC